MFITQPSKPSSRDGWLFIKGKVFEHVEYMPYGETWIDEAYNTENTGFKFTSKELDPETRMYYYGARHMDPMFSRWMSVDPGEDGLNWYGYGNSNPVMYVDPTGESATLVGALTGSIIGGAFAAYNSHGNWKRIAAGAARGAVEGAMMGSVIDTGGASLGVMMAAGAMSSVTGGMVERAITGDKTTVAVVATDAVAGAAGVMVGEAAGRVASKVVAKTAAKNSTLLKTSKSASVETSKVENKTVMSFEEALEVLGENSNFRPGQTVISRGKVMYIVDNYNPRLAQSSVYKNGNVTYLVEGHHTTVANKMLGKGSSYNMNAPTEQMPSAMNVYWTKKWYEFWKRAIKVLD